MSALSFPEYGLLRSSESSWRRVGRFHKILLLIMLLACSFFARGIYLQGKAIVAQQLLTFAWARFQLDGQAHKAWPWADGSPIAQLSIAGQAPLIILSGATGNNLAFAPAWMVASSSFGEGGNSVIVAHNDTHFKLLKELQTDSILTLNAYPDAQLYYQVIATKIVHESDLSVLDVTDQELLTLITCYPFTRTIRNSDLRFVVVAKRIKKPVADLKLASLGITDN